MQIIQGTKDFHLKNSCVTLGKFDGVHLGHRKLLKTLVEDKKRRSVVFTFVPTNDAPMHANQISTMEEQEEILRALGISVLIRYPFSKLEASMSAEDFVKEVLVEKLDAKHIVIGTDFHFGFQCKGDYQLLQRLSDVYGYQLTVHEKVRYQGEEISSSRIRACMEREERKAVSDMLGR